MKEIIGFCGVVGSGKDYAAKELIKKDPRFVQVDFADKVREFAWTSLGWEPKSDEQYEAFKKSAKISISTPNTYDYTVMGIYGKTISGRQYLINIGNGLRKNNPKIWINFWLETIRSLDHVVVTDVRYPNEAEAIASIGGKIIFTNYKSVRYDDTIESESEHMAQQFILEDIKHYTDITHRFL